MSALMPELVTKDEIPQTLIKLRRIRQKHARKVAALCALIKKAARGLVAVEKALDKDAAKVAGKEYKNKYDLSFQKHGSNESQVELDGLVTMPDFQSILDMATKTEADALEVADAEEPAELPYEDVMGSLD